MALMTLPSTTATEAQHPKETSDDGRKAEIGSDDVLMGRGARATENEGNVRFRSIVRSRLRDYLTAPRRQDKDQIAREILGIIKGRKGRFLRKVESVDGGENSSQGGGSSDFVSVEDDVALLKVKQALRDQKLEDTNSSSLKNDTVGCVDLTQGKKLGSPFEPRGFNTKNLEVAGLLPPTQAFQPSLGSGVDALILRQYLNSQAPVAAPRATYPEGLASSLLAQSSLGLPVADALAPSPSVMLQASQLAEARKEAALRSAILAQSQNALTGLANSSAAAFSPLFGGVPSGLTNQPPLVSSPTVLDAEARLQLIQQANAAENLAAALRTRAAGFQEPGDVLDAGRALKRHKAV